MSRDARYTSGGPEFTAAGNALVEAARLYQARTFGRERHHYCTVRLGDGLEVLQPVDRSIPLLVLVLNKRHPFCA